MSETKNVKISVAGDEMKAFISIHPDESKKTISIDFLIGLLKDYGVVFGIKKEVLAILSAKYNHGHIIENILVAEGIAPFAGVEPAVQYKFERSHTPKVDESGKTDYREIDKFLNINSFRRTDGPVPIKVFLDRHMAQDLSLGDLLGK